MKRGYVLRFPFFVANRLKIGNLLKTYLEKILWVNENKLKKLFFIPILFRRFTSSNNKTLSKWQIYLIN